MANGETFAEIRKIVDEGDDITLKGGLKLALSALSDIHDKVDKTNDRVKAIESVTKYPSYLWFLINHPLQTIGFTVFLGLLIAAIFFPDARAMLLDVLLGWL